ncbi:unnamed protein product [Strongylus vulgaris]|uniref:Uncharacterized protein n=1 Tax=Strongylus vulgaris TaxID=40348 RepID=A0A3P7LES4_STRVU|nr:unnamed protein product [Strongylus vulgaris]
MAQSSFVVLWGRSSYTVVHLIDLHRILSPRLAVLRLPADDSELDAFYEDLEEVNRKEKSSCNVVGCFNANIGMPEEGMGAESWKRRCVTSWKKERNRVLNLEDPVYLYWPIEKDPAKNCDLLLRELRRKTKKMIVWAAFVLLEEATAQLKNPKLQCPPVRFNHSPCVLRSRDVAC